MTDDAFDSALVAAFFAAAARDGWHTVSVAGAAREAGLDLARARMRFGSKRTVLRVFGHQADRAALGEAVPLVGPVHERLFDMIMRRIDVLQVHRAGILALLRALPADPLSAALLATETLASMRWLLDAGGLASGGPLGLLRANGLLAVWLWAVRAWQGDESVDLAATMAALDVALDRAAQVARALPQSMAGDEAADPVDPVPEMTDAALLDGLSVATATMEPPVQ